MSKDKICQLYTPEGETLTGIPWDVYPRPQLRRDSFINLNGDWKFKSENNDCTIRVPFCPESLLSGVSGEVGYDEVLRYTRNFELEEKPEDKRLLLHFGAVSRDACVFVNGIEVARNNNAYLPFSADITSAVRKGTNELCVEVENSLSPKYPSGKQKIRRGGMWYTPVSGIWQTVWLEAVPRVYIKSLKILADDVAAEIELEYSGTVVGPGDVLLEDGGGRDTPFATALCEGRSYPVAGGRVRIEPFEKHLWSPEDPYLYNVTIKVGEDRVDTYFALRKLEIKEFDGIRRLCLNGRPYFFNGVLDQGYYSDGIYTPAVPGLYGQDIMRMKALGFNTLRKHIKVEPEQFYYDCDRLGMVVFQDMVNNGVYNYLFDTVFPNFGLRGFDRLENGVPSVRKEFAKAMEATVAHLYNHPCICYWTIFNEGWGQFDADGMFDRLKALDPSRFIDATSGWFKRKKSDVESLHIYFKKLEPGNDTSRPLVLSEFGGYVYKVKGHSFNTRDTYGYKIYLGQKEFIAGLKGLYENEVVPLAKAGLCASVYTQVSDVEDETNGLLTYDRKVCKVEPGEFAYIGQRLQEAVQPGNGQ